MWETFSLWLSNFWVIIWPCFIGTEVVALLLLIISLFSALVTFWKWAQLLCPCGMTFTPKALSRSVPFSLEKCNSPSNFFSLSVSQSVCLNHNHWFGRRYVGFYLILESHHSKKISRLGFLKWFFFLNSHFLQLFALNWPGLENFSRKVMKNESRNVILKCLNNVNHSCHQLFSGEGVKRGPCQTTWPHFMG